MPNDCHEAGFNVPRGGTAPPPSFNQVADRQTEWDEAQHRIGSILAGPSGLGNFLSGSFSLNTTIRRGPPDTDLQANYCEQNQPRVYLTDQLRILQQHYTFVDSKRAVIDFLSDDPALFPLLNEAVRPLQDAFGDNRIIHVRVQNSDDDRLLRVTAQLPVDFQSSENALEAFDTVWWLNNCQRSGGGLVFDYEIQDGV